MCCRRHTDRSVAYGRKPPKLVHNLIFSMPKGTPSDKLEAAVRAFALDRFALQHRYAMALHTHQGNPHVHLVVRALSEQGVRLNIRKATLRDWRQQFAAHLREQGIAANATERAVRGATRVPKTDGVFRSDRARTRPPMFRRSLIRLFVATGNQPEPGKAARSSQPVAKWSKAGMSFTMSSNAKDTRTSLVTSADSWRKCIHP